MRSEFYLFDIVGLSSEIALVQNVIYPSQKKQTNKNWKI